LLIPLDGAASPERKEQICLNDLDGFVAFGGNAKCQPLGKLGQLGMQLRFCGVEFAGNRANCQEIRLSDSRQTEYVLVVSKNGEREQTREGVWN